MLRLPHLLETPVPAPSAGGRRSWARFAAAAVAGFLTAYAADLPAQLDFSEPVATLQAPDDAVGNAFGEQVAITETTLLVSAPRRTNGALEEAGAIYVFDRDSQAFLRRIDEPSPSSFSRFPWQAISTGHGDLFLVGPRLFNARTGQLVRTFLPQQGEQANGWGQCGLLSPDYAVVFNIFEDNDDAAGGAAYVFAMPSGQFLRSIDSPLDPVRDFSWGNSGLIDGDSLFAGSVYAHDKIGAGAVTESDLVTGELLGYHPDVTNGQNLLGGGVRLTFDGSEVLALPSYDDGFPYGWAYLYPRGSSEPRLSIQSPQLAGSSNQEGFGNSCIVLPSEILFGAPRRRPPGGEVVGTVYRFSLANGAPLGELANPDPQAGRGFGSGMARTSNRLYVGAGVSFGPAGRVYVYEPTVETTGLAIR